MSDELKTYLNYLENTGIKTLPVDLKTLKKEKTKKQISTNPTSKVVIQKNTKLKEDKKTYIDYDAIKVDFDNFKNYSTMEELSKHLNSCKKCSLSKLRQNVVIGEGNINADLMFIGEAPGETEDKTGKPFVGRAGNLLTKIIEAMHLSRKEVYIANIVKCRPPGNRNPLPEEVELCLPYLLEQINIIKPKIIVLLGAVALKTLFKSKHLSITMLRGKYIDWNGVKVMPTFHPAYLLRNPYDKKYVWTDMKKVMSNLGIKL